MSASTGERPPFWRNINVLRVVAQVVAVVVVAGVLWWLINNLLTGLDEQGIPFGLGFLDDPAGFTIRDSGGIPAPLTELDRKQGDNSHKATTSTPDVDAWPTFSSDWALRSNTIRSWNSLRK